MAVIWEVTITPLDVARKTASVLGVRTDDISGEVSSFKIDTAVLNTIQQKLDARQQLRNMHLAHEVRKSQIATYLGSMESDAKTWLEAQE